MERMRKPFQGVTNIIRFNWHFYVLSLIVVSILVLLPSLLVNVSSVYFYTLAALILMPVLVSLLVSYYVYDASDLYSLNWVKSPGAGKLTIVNINAGFDEMSELLKVRHNDSDLIVFDFYNPLVHTEVSIKRARQRYPPYNPTQSIETKHIPLAGNSVDMVFVIFAAHEIRNDNERVIFFNELRRIIKQDGKIIITEHLRDSVNFAAYNIGFFHFFPRKSWLNIFQRAQLKVLQEIKITPFVSTFILTSYGHTH